MVNNYLFRTRALKKKKKIYVGPQNSNNLLVGRT